MFSHLSPPESPPEHPGNPPASSHTGTAHMCTHPSHSAIHVSTSVRLGSYWASPQACSLSFVEKHACQKKELISCLSLFLFIKTKSPIAQTGLELQILLPPPLESGIPHPVLPCAIMFSCRVWFLTSLERRDRNSEAGRLG